MKKRLDVLLVERGLATSREKAKAMIMAGEVLVDNEREDKAGSMFPEEVEIVLKGKPLPARLEAAERSARCLYGAHEHPLRRDGGYRGETVLRIDRRIVYLPDQGAASGPKSDGRERRNCSSDQAAV